MEEIPENLVHDHEKNGLPRLSSLAPQEITHRLVRVPVMHAGLSGPGSRVCSWLLWMDDNC